MFGGPIDFPKRVKPQPWPKKLNDVAMPCQQPYRYAHNARPPNSNYSVRLLHYRQRLKETLDKIRAKCNEEARNDKIFIQYFNHYDKKNLQRDIRQRVEAKLKAADKALDFRRHKLMDMLAQEERQYFYETVDQAQRGKEDKLAEMKIKAEKIKARREADRLKVVEEKRFIQYRDQNELLRPALEKLHNIESKMVNLQQMRENECKREAERETDMFFHKVMIKNIEEKARREEQDALKHDLQMRNIVNTWDQQIRGKELLHKEIAAVKAEDTEELQKNLIELKRELQEERLRMLNERQARRDDLTRQIELRNKFHAQRQKELDNLDKAYAHLNSLEFGKEQESDYESRLQARKEMMTYRNYVAELKQKRLEEEGQMQAVLEADQKEIIRKQDEVKCRMKAAKEKLKNEVFAARARQLEEIKLRREKQIEEEKSFAEFMKKTSEIDKCLQEETERLKTAEVLQYRDDLFKQMEYNQQMREREKQEVMREEMFSTQEEEKYMEIMNKMIQDKIESGSKHPFRELLTDFECYCKEHGEMKK